MNKNTAPFTDELDDCTSEAALYALGALTPERTSAFELRLRSGCSYCAAQFGQFAAVADQLAIATTPVEPRPELRQRLLASIQARPNTREATDRMRIIRGGDAPWVTMPFDGVEIRRLIGEKTLMVRMQPGAVFPEHEHHQPEQCYVLEGSITDSDGITLSAGDFVVMSTGTHAPLRSETGCTLFIAYSG